MDRDLHSEQPNVGSLRKVELPNSGHALIPVTLEAAKSFSSVLHQHLAIISAKIKIRSYRSLCITTFIEPARKYKRTSVDFLLASAKTSCFFLFFFCFFSIIFFAKAKEPQNSKANSLC